MGIERLAKLARPLFGARINPNLKFLTRSTKFEPYGKKVLLEKAPRRPISEYSSDFEFIPPQAREFSHVRIGKPEDPKYLQEVFNYYDRDGNLINQLMRETGKNDIFIEYSPWQNLFGINDKARKITRMSVSRNKAKPEVEMYGRFRLTKDRCTPFMPLNNKNAKIVSEELQQIETKKQRFNLIKDRYIEKEYYKGFELAKEPRVVLNDANFTPATTDIRYSGITRSYGKSQEIPEHISIRNNELNLVYGERNYSGADLYLKKQAKDVKITDFRSYNSYKYAQMPNNPFLAYLYLRPQTKAKYLGRFFAKDKGILPMNVKIITNSNEVAENAAGHFLASKCQIHLKNEFNSPLTICHEMEHAKQYSLIGQYRFTTCPGFMPYISTRTEIRAANLFGPCQGFKQMRKGKIFENAHNSYPELSSNEDLLANPRYWNNELEVGARASELEWIKYDTYPHSSVISLTNY